MKNILFLTMLCSFSARATSYLDFVEVIQRKCSLSNTLIIKKTYLSLMKDSKDCQNSFIINLLNMCTTLTCNEIVDEFSIAQGEKNGNIIGGRQ